uniref:Uncharacterized protein n=1 Tax=Trichinella nativa TaxID=6335 RepID=A0A0V1KI34_9BILA
MQVIIAVHRAHSLARLLCQLGSPCPVTNMCGVFINSI